MATTETRTVTVRQAQAKADKAATLALLRSKRKRTKELKFKIDDETVILAFQALSSKDLDKLRSKHQPTMDQKLDGMQFNPETFPPALISACATQPEMTYEEAKELWDSDDWSQGELSTLFQTVMALCTEGLDVPFTGSV